MRLLVSLNSWLARVEEFILSTALLAMVLLAFLQVILRNFFSFGIVWSDLLVRHMVLWVGFLGASLATREKNHIRVDLFSRFIPARWERPFQALLDLFASIVSFLLFLAALDFVLQEKESGNILFLNVPSWMVQSILPIAFFLISFRFLVNLILDCFAKEIVHAPSVPPGGPLS
ncbi:MAG: TRAP transporter small permease [Deltaproteobacteria bacterium]|nr:TRAP transporter small permease [Deltaproteobacteria bacterium]